MAQWNKYERTAARQHGRQGRDIRPKSTTIDIHSHVAIPAAANFVKSRGQARVIVRGYVGDRFDRFEQFALLLKLQGRRQLFVHSLLSGG